MDANRYASIVVGFIHEFAHSKNKEVINLDKKIVHTNMDVRIRSTYTQKHHVIKFLQICQHFNLSTRRIFISTVNLNFFIFYLWIIDLSVLRNSIDILQSYKFFKSFIIDLFHANSVNNFFVLSTIVSSFEMSWIIFHLVQLSLFNCVQPIISMYLFEEFFHTSWVENAVQKDILRLKYSMLLFIPIRWASIS